DYFFFSCFPVGVLFSFLNPFTLRLGGLWFRRTDTGAFLAVFPFVPIFLVSIREFLCLLSQLWPISFFLFSFFPHLFPCFLTTVTTLRISLFMTLLLTTLLIVVCFVLLFLAKNISLLDTLLNLLLVGVSFSFC